MHKQQQHISSRHVPSVPSRKTATIEQKLAQLQAQLHAIPTLQGDDYQHSLAMTRRFARTVRDDLDAWLAATSEPGAERTSHV